MIVNTSQQEKEATVKELIQNIKDCEDATITYKNDTFRLTVFGGSFLQFDQALETLEDSRTTYGVKEVLIPSSAHGPMPTVNAVTFKCDNAALKDALIDAVIHDSGH
jgi:hypothetical protein|tara:strand:- start:350 stop:670 length:321 start_codon:yes stop_codon:yes gene_type:complete